LDTSATFSTSQEGFGSPLPSFVGISNLTLDDGESQSLNAQTQLVLKKLNKKDAITRLKVCFAILLIAKNCVVS